MANEAGFATAWLCRNGLDGTAIIAEHLNAMHDCGVEVTQLRSIDDAWSAGKSGLCALSAGATVSDLALDSRILRCDLKQVITPALLLPFIGYAAMRRNQMNHSTTPSLNASRLGYTSVQCQVFKAEILTRNSITWIHRYSPADVPDSAIDDLSIQRYAQHADTHFRIGEHKFSLANAETAPNGELEPLAAHRTQINPHALVILKRFAELTYAPATDESRRGAGAGDTDND